MEISGKIERQNFPALFRRRQIDKKEFIKPAAAQQFTGKHGNVIGRSYDKDLFFTFLQPEQKLPHHAGRYASIIGRAGAGKAFFDFVDPEDTRRYIFCRCERIFQLLFRLTHIAALDRSEIEAVQG